MSKAKWLNEVKWDDGGLVPVIAQDAVTAEVLMFAWMNREALEITVQGGEAVYWSRSRRKLWRKGEESGHTQKVREIRLDCDNDVVLLKIEHPTYTWALYAAGFFTLVSCVWYLFDGIKQLGVHEQKSPLTHKNAKG